MQRAIRLLWIVTVFLILCVLTLATVVYQLAYVPPAESSVYAVAKHIPAKILPAPKLQTAEILVLNDVGKSVGASLLLTAEQADELRRMFDDEHHRLAIYVDVDPRPDIGQRTFFSRQISGDRSPPTGYPKLEAAPQPQP